MTAGLDGWAVGGGGALGASFGSWPNHLDYGSTIGHGVLAVVMVFAVIPIFPRRHRDRVHQVGLWENLFFLED